MVGDLGGVAFEAFYEAADDLLRDLEPPKALRRFLRAVRVREVAEDFVLTLELRIFLLRRGSVRTQETLIIRRARSIPTVRNLGCSG